MEYVRKDTKNTQQTLKQRVLISIQSIKDKVFNCLLFTVLFTIISIMSSMILKLHMGLVIFLDMICSPEFIKGFPFFFSIVQVCRSITIGNKTQ